MKTLAILVTLLLPSVASAQLNTRQMKTTGTPTTIPASASNGISDSVARVDHAHPCAVASSTQAGCLSSVDWLIFDGKEEPLSFTSGLTRAGNTVSCVDASGIGKGCVTTTAQTFGGAKTFPDGIITPTVDAPSASSLRLRALAGTLILESGTDAKLGTKYPITLLPSNDVLYSPSTTPRTLTLDLASDTAGRAVFEITNSGSVESTYGADLSVPKGDLFVGDVARVELDGDAVFAALSATSYSSHGHTDASSGGVLSATAIASGTLAVARGGTGVSSATSDAVLVGNGSAWQAKTIPDCDATGARLRYDATTNAFSCATAEAWTTVSSFSNSWGACVSFPPRYRLDSDGAVNLSGCIASGTLGSQAFVLPSAYQPSATRYFAVATTVAGAVCTLRVSSAGVVVAMEDCSNSAVFLDGVTFWTD